MYIFSKTKKPNPQQTQPTTTATTTGTHCHSHHYPLPQPLITNKNKPKTKSQSQNQSQTQNQITNSNPHPLPLQLPPIITATTVITIINDVEPTHTTTNKNSPIIPKSMKPKPTNFTQLKPMKPKTTTTIPCQWPTDLHADDPRQSPCQSHFNTNAHIDALVGQKVSRLGLVLGVGEKKGRDGAEGEPT